MSELQEQLYGALARLEQRKRQEPKEPEGDPLVIVMQLEELSKKLDQVIVLLDKITLRLERMEERQKQGLEGIKEAKGPTVGTFGSSEL
jgi:hypothetical protein